jgi:hypothetical protein
MFKNKHQAVSPGNISSKLKAPSSKEKTPSAQLPASSFPLPDVSITKAAQRRPTALRRGFSTPGYTPFRLQS